MGALAAALLSLVACGAEPAKLELGKLPSAVTTAEPEWLPFAIRAGARVPDDPREQRLADLREVAAAGNVSRVAWAADGRSVVLENELGVVVLDLSTGKIVRVSEPSERPSHGASAGPHGEYVVYAASSGSASPPGRADGAKLVSVRRDGTDRVELGSGILPVVVGDGSQPLDALFSVSFERASGGILVMQTLRASADALSFESASAEQTFGPVSDFTVSADRTRAAWLTEDGSLQVASLAASGEVRATRTLGAHGVSVPAFHPSGRHVVVSTTVDDPQAQLALVDLRAVDADTGAEPGRAPTPPTTGRPAERITFANGGARAPAFSPDGRYLAFVSERAAPRTGTTHLFIARWRADP